MKTKQGGLFALIILLIVVFVLFKVYQKHGWKTYTNSEYQFSIKYPPGWSVNEYYPFITNNLNLYIFLNPTGRESGDQYLFENSVGVKQDINISGAKAQMYSCPDVQPCIEKVAYSRVIQFSEYPPSWSKDNTFGFFRTTDQLTNFKEDNKTAEEILKTIKFNK